jgi:hypothetical protein
MEKNLGTIVPIEDMPEIVHEPYAFLLDNTGVEATVERNGYGRMLLTHLGERTKMTIQFRLNSRKWQWEKSCLWIDGERAPLASGWDMYTSIYQDPDNGRHTFTPKGAKKAKIPESRPVDEQYLPLAVTKELRGLRATSEKETTTIVPTVVSSANQYLITVTDTETGQKFVFVFGHQQGDWALVDLILVNAKGYDVTNYVGEAGIDSFLHQLLGVAGRASQVTYNPLGSVQAAATTNSVNVRKSTVRRV